MTEAHAPGGPGDLLGPEVGRDDGHVARPLTGEGPQLCLQVGLERPVPVEVVWGEVEQHSGLRGEGERVFELKGGCLAHDRDALLGDTDEPTQCRADVAGHGHRKGGLTMDVADQLNRRGLAVCAGHEDELVGKHPPGELELAEHAHPT